VGVLLVKPWEMRRADGGSGGGAVVATAAHAGPNRILVADFDGTGVQPELTVATRELMSAALAQSGFMTPIPHTQVERGLKYAGYADSTRIEGEVARELAYRASARVYVSGRVDKVLTGYSIVIQVSDSETNQSKITLRDVAENDPAVITTLDRMARQLREKLGENADAVRTTSKLREITTPSFDAYKLYVQAVQQQNERKYVPSNQTLRRALAFDPDFSSAWSIMGINDYNLGFLDSARVAFDAARRKPDRLTDRERLGLEVYDAFVDYDLQKAADLYEELSKQPNYTAMQANNRGTCLFSLGRYEEALESQKRASELQLYGTAELITFNEFRTLTQLGRRDEARALIDSLTGANRELARLELAVDSDDWEHAAELASANAAATNAGLRFESDLLLASLRAREGAVKTSMSRFEELARTAPNPFWSDLTRVAGVYLASMAGQKLTQPAQAAGDTSTSGWIVRGIAAAASGDVATAKACRKAVDAKRLGERRRYAVDTSLLEGWIAFAEKRWDDVVVDLGTETTEGPGPWFVGRPAIRWLVAQAHERAGRTEDATRAYELVLDPRRQHHDVWTWRPLLGPFAHQRLAVLYAKSGHVDDAKRHLEALEKAWEAPDPSLKPLLDAARRTVESAASTS